MKLWYIWQEQNRGYDTYDSAVVAAETEDAAKKIHPGDYLIWHANAWRYPHDQQDSGDYGDWAHVDAVKVEYIGEAKEGTEAGVIVSSFNAG